MCDAGKDNARRDGVWGLTRALHPRPPVNLGSQARLRPRILEYYPSALATVPLSRWLSRRRKRGLSFLGQKKEGESRVGRTLEGPRPSLKESRDRGRDEIKPRTRTCRPQAPLLAAVGLPPSLPGNHASSPPRRHARSMMYAPGGTSTGFQDTRRLTFQRKETS